MKTWYLIYLLSTSTSGGHIQYVYPMESQEACIESVKTARVEVPNGGDAESTVTVFCASDKGERE